MRDKATVSRSPGVGAKVAERIVTELKDKVPAFTHIDPAVVHCRGRWKKSCAPQPIARRGLGPRQSRLWPAAGRRCYCGRRAQCRRRRRHRATDPGWLEGARKMSAPRLVAAESATTMSSKLSCGRNVSPSSSARKRRAPISRCSSRPRARAKKRSTTCCSSVHRAWARPHWRRSWRANWGQFPRHIRPGHRQGRRSRGAR